MYKLPYLSLIRFMLLVLLAIPIFTAIAQQQEPNASEKLPEKKQSISADHDCTNQPPPKQTDWMESFHTSVSNSVYQSAIWFDNFFLDEGTRQQTPKTTARIRLGWEPKARDWQEFDTRFRIKVKLPHFKDRVDLILSDDDDSDNTQSALPLESINSEHQLEEEHFSAAVRYTYSRSKNRIFESRLGISGGDIFFRVKHDRRLTWNSQNSFKIEPSIYYFLDDGLGAKLLLEYDYQMDEKSQFRLNYSIRGSASFSGIRWKHGGYYLKQIDHMSASITGIQVEGERNGERGFIIDKYKFSHRYRFNALKSWLFFEIEPFLEWPEEENYTTTPGIALRVEGYFSKG